MKRPWLGPMHDLRAGWWSEPLRWGVSYFSSRSGAGVLMRTRIRLPFGGELGLTQVLSEETTLDRQGEFVTMPNDKTLCISLL